MSKIVKPGFEVFSDVADRFDDIADLMDENPQYDPRPFLRASAARYRAALAGEDTNSPLWGLKLPSHKDTPHGSQ